MTGQLLTFVAALAIALLSSTAVRAGDDEWWAPAWLLKSPYSPSFEVRDTVNKYGRYAERSKTITLGDLIKFHGHFAAGWSRAQSAAACLR